MHVSPSSKINMLSGMNLYPFYAQKCAMLASEDLVIYMTVKLREGV
jgi:hypothetical protein